VHAFDDKCPHQGYPLSQGTVAGCVLTCQWHNWKFDLAPFFAFDMSVRPIRIAHGIKMAEALYRRHLADPEHGVAFLDALLAFSVPRRDENRFRHMAHIASSFFANGRPPEGLY
jgi:hypothetical protein